MPGAPFGPALRNTSMSSALTSSAGSSTRSVMSSTDSNTTARPICCNNLGLAAECLMTAPLGARLPYGNDIAQRRAGDRPGVEIDEIAELRHQFRHAAGVVKVLHVMLAGRL